MERYTFESPLTIPDPPDDQQVGFLDIVQDGVAFKLKWRSLSDYPAIVRKSTGERGRLIRAVTNKFTKKPVLGKVTLLVKQVIASEAGKVEYDDWDEDDWVLVDPPR